MSTHTYPEVGWMKERFQVLTLNDAICTFDWSMEPGGSVPEHLHMESDEHFEVLEGELSIQCMATNRTLKKGESVTVPRLTPHCVSNKSKVPVLCRVTFDPVADQGKFFQILFFLNQKNPRDNMALFKAMYIADCLNYRPFSTMRGGMNFVEKMMLTSFRIAAPLTGWNRLVRQYVQSAVKKA
jgi:quercetin dioxygenase-like cupin family protein